ncbi:Leucine Rich Repeat [Seminavis robusta]|uniref:Leucine Rich Repeat n=1 Tax=Seminavis robusta TaxID=568900 RepID=A0A9N8I1A3_9STRA|nr:Leucine Rich Repeat [Seminavis robusta]|eukprot:Sro3306_g346490.1 Leucine Rich Repeat (715) ;mRNA; r:1550-3839
MNDEAKLATDRGTQDTAPTSAEKAWPQPSANVTNTDDAKAPTDGEETNSDEHNIIESPNLKLPAMASPFSDMDSSLDVNPPENATTTSPASFNPAPAASNPSIATLSGGLQRIAKENAAKEAARASRGSTMVGAGVPGAVLQKSQQRQEDAKKASTSTDARTKPAPTTTVSRGLRRSAEERVAKAAARGNAGNATSGAFPTVPPGGNLNPETIASKNVMVVAPIQHGVYYVAASATSSATTGARSSVSTSCGLGKNRKEADPLRESTDATITKCGVLVPPQRNNSAHDNDITTGTQENNTSKEFSSDLNPPENTVSTNQAFMDDASAVVPAATNAIQMPTISTSDDGLVEARAITESSMFMLQEAQQVDDAVLEQQTARQEKERHCQRVGYAIIFCSIIIIITISLGVGLRPKPEAVKDAMPTFAPTLAPTSLESFLLSLLPEQTITGMEDNDSAQYQAFKWLQEDPFVYDYPDWRILQRHALMTVFYATAGPTQWSNNTGWGSYHLHECAWFQNQEFALKSFIGKLYPGFLAGFLEPLPGSQCDKQGRYLHLWLDQNNLEGSLPEELYSLTSLQTLSAGLNPLYGSFSSYIGQLQQLRGLAFSSTGLSGSIPKEMGNISSFEVIVLNDNQLEGSIPNEIWQLSTLDSLVLGRNEKLGGTMPSIISTLPKLRWLLMDDCALTGSIPTELGQARSLEWLALLGNQLSGTLPRDSA